jgi:hypothetical protein
MTWLRTRLRSWWRRINTLEPVPDDHKPTGHGLVPDDHCNGAERAADVLRDLRPAPAVDLTTTQREADLPSQTNRRCR